MSGIGEAGLALAVFPILVDGLTHIVAVSDVAIPVHLRKALGKKAEARQSEFASAICLLLYSFGSEK